MTLLSSCSRSFLGALIAGTFAATAQAAECNPNAPSDNPWLRKITFADDFDDLSVSAHGPGTRWTAHTPWNGDFGDAQFTDPGPGFPFTLEDGVLSITASKDAKGKWRSGLLSSTDGNGAGFSQKYGYFEIKAQLPPGDGVWPAFWLAEIRTPGQHASNVEIDIFEYYGRTPDRYSSTIHVWPTTPGKPHVSTTRLATSRAAIASGFHTFGAKVGRNCTDFYFDRRKVHSLPTPLALKRPLGVLVNLALGSGWPIDKTPNPSLLRVDYVHVHAPA